MVPAIFPPIIVKTKLVLKVTAAAVVLPLCQSDNMKMELQEYDVVLSLTHLEYLYKMPYTCPSASASVQLIYAEYRL